MQLKEIDGRWFAKKKRTAKRWEDVTDIIEFQGDDFCSVMDKAGRTTFHAYLGKSGGRWLPMHGVTSNTSKFGDFKNLEAYIKRNTVAVALLNPVDDATREHIRSLIPKDGNVTSEVGKKLAKIPEFRKAMNATDEILNNSSNDGTNVHAEIEDFINLAIKNGGRMSAVKEGSEQAREFMRWAVEEQVEFLASERVVFSRKLWCAGTLDFLCRIRGKLYIGDIKTSNYISTKHFIQCGAYAEMLGEKVEGIVIVHLPREGGINVITNEKVGVTVDKLQKCFVDLLGLVKVDDDIKYNLRY